MRSWMKGSFCAVTLVALGVVPTPSAAMQEASPDDRATITRAEIHTRLESITITPEFHNAALQDVLQYLGTQANVNFLPIWAPNRYADGLNPESPITLQLDQPIGLATALDLVLEQATYEDEAASWSAEKGFVRVGYKSSLNAHKYIVVYPVKDLMFEIPTIDDAPRLDMDSVLSGSTDGSITSSIFDFPTGSGETDEERSRPTDGRELISIITALIEPWQWHRMGGDGASIRYFQGGLIVNAPEYIHRQIGGSSQGH